jgi:type IV secretory pathway VirB9-like protein
MKKILYLTAAFFLTAEAAFAQSSGSIDPTTMDKIDSMIEQSSGNYPPLDTNLLTSRGMLQKAWSDPLKNMGEGQTKPGYTRYVWSSDMVLPVRLRESMATLINFPAWEVIDSIWIGDQNSFAGEFPSPNSLLLFTQPGMVGVDSNLIVFGRSGNRYAFYIRSEAYNTDRITNTVVDVVVPNMPSGNSSAGGVVSSSSSKPYWASGVRGASGAPGDSLNPTAGLNVASNAPKGWLEDIPVNPEKFRFDIEVYLPNPSDIDIAPERVWHDDIFTYIDFGPKALAMLERPIVNLIVQDSESPVGFRSRGPNGRLIVVEAVGDMVMRNGEKVVCLKLRRDPAMGLEYVDYSTFNEKHWYVQPPIGPNGTGASSSSSSSYYSSSASASGKAGQKGKNGASSNGAGAAGDDDDMEMVEYLMSNSGSPNNKNIGRLPSGKASAKSKSGVNSTLALMAQDGLELGSYTYTPGNEKITLELAKDKDISKLEAEWEKISRRNWDLIGKYQPYFTVDSSPEGGARELFRLRVGPVSDIKVGDNICGQLSRRGLNCIVVRTQ